MALVSTNNQEAGATAAGQKWQMMEEQGEVLLFIQDHISGSAKQREAGMVNQFQTQYPNIQVGGSITWNELEGLKEEHSREA